MRSAHQNTNSIIEYRKNALHVAKDFGYGKNCIEKIKEAKTEEEITKALESERRRRR